MTWFNGLLRIVKLKRNASPMWAKLSLCDLARWNRVMPSCEWQTSESPPLLRHILKIGGIRLARCIIRFLANGNRSSPETFS